MKTDDELPIDHVGPIPGIEVGMSWKLRTMASKCCVHRPNRKRVHARVKRPGRQKVGRVFSMLLIDHSDFEDEGNVFTYTGHGGKGSDQELKGVNLALAQSCNVEVDPLIGATSPDWKLGSPIRVLRSAVARSPYTPIEGVRYDGIYKVAGYWKEKKGCYDIWRYELRRDDPVPAPWTPEGEERMKKLGFTMQVHSEDEESGDIPVKENIKPTEEEDTEDSSDSDSCLSDFEEDPLPPLEKYRRVLPSTSENTPHHDLLSRGVGGKVTCLSASRSGVTKRTPRKLTQQSTKPSSQARGSTLAAGNDSQLPSDYGDFMEDNAPSIKSSSSSTKRRHSRLSLSRRRARPKSASATSLQTLQSSGGVSGRKNQPRKKLLCPESDQSAHDDTSDSDIFKDLSPMEGDRPGECLSSDSDIFEESNQAEETRTGSKHLPTSSHTSHSTEGSPTPPNLSSFEYLVHRMNGVEKRFQEQFSAMRRGNADRDEKLDLILFNQTSSVIQKYQEQLAAKDKLIEFLRKLVDQRGTPPVSEEATAATSGEQSSSDQESTACKDVVQRGTPPVSEAATAAASGEQSSSNQESTACKDVVQRGTPPLSEEHELTPRVEATAATSGEQSSSFEPKTSSDQEATARVDAQAASQSKAQSVSISSPQPNAISRMENNKDTNQNTRFIHEVALPAKSGKDPGQGNPAKSPTSPSLVAAKETQSSMMEKAFQENGNVSQTVGPSTLAINESENGPVAVIPSTLVVNESENGPVRDCSQTSPSGAGHVTGGDSSPEGSDTCSCSPSPVAIIASKSGQETVLQGRTEETMQVNIEPKTEEGDVKWLFGMSDGSKKSASTVEESVQEMEEEQQGDENGVSEATDVNMEDSIDHLDLNGRSPQEVEPEDFSSDISESILGSSADYRNSLLGSSPTLVVKVVPLDAVMTDESLGTCPSQEIGDKGLQNGAVPVCTVQEAANQPCTSGVNRTDQQADGVSAVAAGPPATKKRKWRSYKAVQEEKRRQNEGRARTGDLSERVAENISQAEEPATEARQNSGPSQSQAESQEEEEGDGQEASSQSQDRESQPHTPKRFKKICTKVKGGLNICEMQLKSGKYVSFTYKDFSEYTQKVGQFSDSQ